MQLLLKRLVPDLARVAADRPFDEHRALVAAKPFLEREFGATVDVFPADKKDVYDPKGRARSAFPRRPAIYVE